MGEQKEKGVRVAEVGAESQRGVKRKGERETGAERRTGRDRGAERDREKEEAE